jgi:N-acetylmuramoyl-L-alanine amidase
MIVKTLRITLISLCLLSQQVLFAATTPFTVVIDAGHGGKDPGTLGSSSREKDIVLAIALKVGALINTRMPDVRVIYTRKGDEYPELYKRAEIANKAKANLFISIHADHADSPTVRGASTFTLGQNRTAENMAIAKRENSVILLEENYKQRYEGFDPNSPESYIMFEFMQTNYMDQSVRFAANIQSQFKRNGRIDRGVRQDVFLVLRNTSMPSVLIEVGFLSNLEEERYLKSAQGQDEVANNICLGFTDFKANFERKSNASTALKSTESDSLEEGKNPVKKDSASEKPEQKQQSAAAQDNATTAKEKEIRFKVQIIASDIRLNAANSKLKGQAATFYKENKLYKYTVGDFDNFNDANNLRLTLTKKFPDCFVIAFKNGQKMPADFIRTEASK